MQLYQRAGVGCLIVCVLIALTGCGGLRDTTRTFTTVVIDAGHGGHDRGAVGRSGTREKDVALDTALRLRRKLQAAGFHVVMTRENDKFIPLGERARIANRQSNAIFVSIHYNHAPRSAARGLETFYHHPHSERLARSVQASIATIGGTPNRGVKHARFLVIRETEIPAILVEGGFLSNRAEESRISGEGYREEIATLIARGIVQLRHGRGTAARIR